MAMETISGLLSVVDAAQANVIIDSSLYEPEAINAATYPFTDKYHITAVRKSDASIVVIFELKNKDSGRDVSYDIKEFINAVIDHQVRLQLDRANGKIRDLIVNHAFSPLDLSKRTNSL